MAAPGESAAGVTVGTLNVDESNPNSLLMFEGMVDLESDLPVVQPSLGPDILSNSTEVPLVLPPAASIQPTQSGASEVFDTGQGTAGIAGPNDATTSTASDPSTFDSHAVTTVQLTETLKAAQGPPTEGIASVVSIETESAADQKAGRRGGLLGVAVRGVAAWEEQGPGPIGGAQVLLPDEKDPAVGAVQDVAVDPNDPRVVYVGTAGGGVWKTDDSTVAKPVWKAKTDQYPSLSISAISIDPTNPKIVYAGTGSYSTGLSEFSGFGNQNTAVGLLRTVDGGDNWALVGGPELQGRRISGIVVAEDGLKTV